MKNKKASMLIAIIMLVVGSIIFLKYKNSSEKIYRNETPSKIREIKLLDNDKFVFVAVDNYSDGVILFGQNYITTFSSHTLDTTNFEKTPQLVMKNIFKLIVIVYMIKKKLLNLIYMNYLGRIIYIVLFIIFLIVIYKMTMIT